MSNAYARALAALYGKPAGSQLTRIPMPEETADAQHTGIMVAFMLPTELATQMAVTDGEPASELHLTLTYNAPDEDTFGGVEKVVLLLETVQAWAQTITGGGLTGVISGPGYFLNNGQSVSVLLPDIAGLPDARQTLTTMLTQVGLPFADNHGYTPHITVAYRQLPVENLSRWAGTDLDFDRVTVCVGGVRMSYRLGSGEHLPEEQDSELAEEFALAYTTGVTTGITLPAEVSPRAFTTEHNGRIMVTAPATVGLGTGLDWQTTPRIAASDPVDNLWIVGRLVGGDKPNRNGAMWSAEDLATANETAALMPLNWLHDRSRIIGSVVETQFVPADPTRTGPGEIPDPHIVALATMWPYCNPAEAQVIAQASEMGMLWYSMECRADEIKCTGPSGCGAVFPYTQYQTDPTSCCIHLQMRSSVRQLINPHFRGAAVIVPPSRPGWADADAITVSAAEDPAVDEAAALAFEEAGRPAMSRAAWTHLITEVMQVADNL